MQGLLQPRFPQGLECMLQICELAYGTLCRGTRGTRAPTLPRRFRGEGRGKQQRAVGGFGGEIWRANP